jgi:DNA polymerase-1
VNKYIEILRNLKEESATNDNPNSRILLVDGLNLFIRSFAATPVVNDNGEHIGGITGSLLSMGYAIKMLKPTRVIVCFDGKGGSVRRRKLYDGYKSNRKVSQKVFRPNTYSLEEEKVSMTRQMSRLIEYMDNLPITTLAIDNIEADDAIAYITQQIYNQEECFIMSSDKDFLQLVDDRVRVWSPTKKKLYDCESVFDEFGIHSHNFLEYRSIIGDKSDNIGGIRGAGPKSLKKQIPILFDSESVGIHEIIDYVCNSNSKSKLIETIRDSKSILERNYQLMQLRDVDISGFAKSSIMDSVRQPINRLNKLAITRMLIQDMMNTSIKNPDVWIREVFTTLNVMADKSHSV